MDLNLAMDRACGVTEATFWRSEGELGLPE